MAEYIKRIKYEMFSCDCDARFQKNDFNLKMYFFFNNEVKHSIYRK